jgi:hypothetical protein
MDGALIFPGLRNAATSCWANALFQALASLPPLHEHLQRMLLLHVLSGAHAAALFPLVEVSRALRGLCAPHASPTTAALPRLALLRASGQQDAHELLMVLLQTVFERAPPPPPATARRWPSPHDVPAAALRGRPLLAAPRAPPPPPPSPFSFLLARRCRCLACGKGGAWVVDAESALEVAPPQGAGAGGGAPAPLARLALAALGGGVAEGWRCEGPGGCGAAAGAARAALLLRPPRVLTVHVKREGGGGGAPSRARVAVPLEMALPLGAPVAGAPPPAPAAFQLAAALCHVGASGGGHYSTLRRAPARAGSGARRRWLSASDARVEDVDARALAPLGDWVSDSVVLAFFLLRGGGGACVGAAGAGARCGGEEEAEAEAEEGLTRAAADAAAAGAHVGEAASLSHGFEAALRRAADAPGATAVGLLPLLVPAEELPRGCGHEAMELP